MPLQLEFLIATVPLGEVETDPLRTSARALKYSNDVVKTTPKSADIPQTYATRNKPTQGEVTGS
jgi:hypothetical protein